MLTSINVALVWNDSKIKMANDVKIGQDGCCIFDVYEVDEAKA
jgi:hypothetical protein